MGFQHKEVQNMKILLKITVKVEIFVILCGVKFHKIRNALQYGGIKEMK